MYKHLSVVIISIFFLSFLWRGLWSSASPVLKSQNNSFHCFILIIYSKTPSFLCVSCCSAESFCSLHPVKRDLSHCFTPRQLQFGYFSILGAITSEHILILSHPKPKGYEGKPTALFSCLFSAVLPVPFLMVPHINFSIHHHLPFQARTVLKSPLLTGNINFPWDWSSCGQGARTDLWSLLNVNLLISSFPFPGMSVNQFVPGWISTFQERFVLFSPLPSPNNWRHFPSPHSHSQWTKWVL